MSESPELTWSCGSGVQELSPQERTCSLCPWAPHTIAGGSFPTLSALKAPLSFSLSLCTTAPNLGTTMSRLFFCFLGWIEVSEGWFLSDSRVPYVISHSLLHEAAHIDYLSLVVTFMSKFSNFHQQVNLFHSLPSFCSLFSFSSALAVITQVERSWTDYWRNFRYI